MDEGVTARALYLVALEGERMFCCQRSGTSDSFKWMDGTRHRGKSHARQLEEAGALLSMRRNSRSGHVTAVVFVRRVRSACTCAIKRASINNQAIQQDPQDTLFLRCFLQYRPPLHIPGERIEPKAIGVGQPGKLNPHRTSSLPPHSLLSPPCLRQQQRLFRLSVGRSLLRL